MNSLIIGINAFHGDASAAVLNEGHLVAAIEEERLNRIKHWAGLPLQAAKSCLNGHIPDYIAVSRNPAAHISRKVVWALTNPRQIPCLASRALNGLRISRVDEDLRENGIARSATTIRFVEHHRAHLASAFFCSPFDEAAVVSIDGFGDFTSAMWGVGRENKINVKGSVDFPHSLGLFYTAFTQFLGFPKYGDEYKMMGLAAYGEPRFMAQVRQVLETRDGRCRLDLRYFTHHRSGVEMSWNNCEPILGPVYSTRMVEVFGSPRTFGAEVEQKHADLACSVQRVLEDNYFELLNYIQDQTQAKALCLAGGVALNCVANGMVFDKTDFQDVYIQPAANDAGTAIGAALYVHHQMLNRPRDFIMRHVYYGPEYSDAEIAVALHETGACFHKLNEDGLLERTVEEIISGKIVGWFQGRMEFGPRALGNRSMLADPRREDMKDILNRRIKHREVFRPFCPSILAERTGEYFETDYPSPFMVAAYKIKPHQRGAIPAVTHGDGTGRLQTVAKDVNPLYWKLIRRFADKTGIPVLLNTSFNENEPIVNTPAEAIDCFLRTRMDTLAIGSFILCKEENSRLSANRVALAEA